MDNECILDKFGANPANPIDAGDGWTLYINWQKEMARSSGDTNPNDPCVILAYIDRIKSYKAAESPMATHDQLACGRCKRIVDISIFRYDAGLR
jgi:hypothetical protein